MLFKSLFVNNIIFVDNIPTISHIEKYKYHQQIILINIIYNYYVVNLMISYSWIVLSILANILLHININYLCDIIKAIPYAILKENAQGGFQYFYFYFTLLFYIESIDHKLSTLCLYPPKLNTCINKARAYSKLRENGQGDNPYLYMFFTLLFYIELIDHKLSRLHLHPSINNTWCPTQYLLLDSLIISLNRVVNHFRVLWGCSIIIYIMNKPPSFLVTPPESHYMGDIICQIIPVIRICVTTRTIIYSLYYTNIKLSAKCIRAVNHFWKVGGCSIVVYIRDNSPSPPMTSPESHYNNMGHMIFHIPVLIMCVRIVLCLLYYKIIKLLFKCIISTYDLNEKMYIYVSELYASATYTYLNTPVNTRFISLQIKYNNHKLHSRFNVRPNKYVCVYNVAFSYNIVFIYMYMHLRINAGKNNSGKYGTIKSIMQNQKFLLYSILGDSLDITKYNGG